MSIVNNKDTILIYAKIIDNFKLIFVQYICLASYNKEQNSIKDEAFY